MRLLCATSGVGNAGIDCPDVRTVYRIDFPPSILDLAQEKGRAGRRPNTSADNFHYTVCYSLESFLYLFKRTLDPSEEYVNKDYRQIQIDALLQVAKVLITSVERARIAYRRNQPSSQFLEKGLQRYFSICSFLPPKTWCLLWTTL